MMVGHDGLLSVGKHLDKGVHRVILTMVKTVKSFMERTTAKEDLRYQPLYSSTEVGRYARVNPGIVRAWTRAGDRSSIVVPAAKSSPAPLSFINLVEFHILVALRKTHKVPMQKIRRFIEYGKRTYGVEHPLAELDLETDGSEVFVRELGFSVNASRGGQIALPKVLSQYLRRIERDPAHIPIRFYPLTYEASPKLIVVNPAVAYGRPVIEGTRITTRMVFERYSGGESLLDIAADYELNISAVEEALRCEIGEQRAA
jgi:uncharacterized protein (DUF433 family)